MVYQTHQYGKISRKMVLEAALQETIFDKTSYLIIETTANREVKVRGGPMQVGIVQI